MDFEYDDEQQALRDAVRALLGKAYGDFEKRREVTRSSGYSADTWGRLAEMGVLGLPFAEADGGMGAGPVEVGIVAEELGRVLAPEPFLSAVVLAGGAVAAAGSEAQRAALLEPLSTGESLLAWAHTEPGGGYGEKVAGVTAQRGSGGETWTLTGVKDPVVYGEEADVLVVTAVLPDGDASGSVPGTGLFVVRADAEGLTREGYRTHDGGRAATVRLDGTPAEPLGDGGDATAVVRRVLDAGRVAAAAEAVGLMGEALSDTRDYLTTRKQFGVTLNTFQALTFRAADMYVDLELTRSLVLWATMVLADGTDDEASVASSRAALQVASAGRRLTQEAIQLHGGIGVTAEYSVGHRLSRLEALLSIVGDERFHLARLAGGVASYGEVDPIP